MAVTGAHARSQSRCQETTVQTGGLDAFLHGARHRTATGRAPVPWQFVLSQSLRAVERGRLLHARWMGHVRSRAMLVLCVCACATMQQCFMPPHLHPAIVTSATCLSQSQPPHLRCRSPYAARNDDGAGRAPRGFQDANLCRLRLARGGFQVARGRLR